jgi:hypothetical protein
MNEEREALKRDAALVVGVPNAAGLIGYTAQTARK